ncbi:hypothetical protein R9X47_01220 [Wukongibacter baidiensis]|uniref:hypothetical protein n=1 Tax=Wukongibacter baidiensis TaxID=1723361 RepID=UPI003D7FBB2C
MGKTIADKHEKIDKMLIKMVISLCIVLMFVQGYLRIVNRGIEPFLNKLYKDEGLSFKIMEIVQ